MLWIVHQPFEKIHRRAGLVQDDRPDDVVGVNRVWAGVLLPVGDGAIARRFVGRERADEEFDERISLVEILTCGEADKRFSLGSVVRFDQRFDDSCRAELVRLIDLVCLWRVQFIEEHRGPQVSRNNLLVGGIGAFGKHARGRDEFFGIVRFTEDVGVFFHAGPLPAEFVDADLSLVRGVRSLRVRT